MKAQKAYTRFHNLYRAMGFAIIYAAITALLHWHVPLPATAASPETPYPAKTATRPTSSPATQPAPFVLTWGKRGAGPGEFNVPIGLAINAADEIYVTDFRNKRVQKFDPNGKQLAVYPVTGQPAGIAVDAAGRWYVSMFLTDSVAVYDGEGKLICEWGKTGTGPGEFKEPGGIAIGADGGVYVADQVNRRIQKFDAEAKFLLTWGEYGVGPGQFGGNIPKEQRVGGPHFLAFDKDGNINATEASLGRVQKFDNKGGFLLAWGDNQIAPGSFGGGRLLGPIGICFDRDDRVWVSSTNNRVQQFTATGKYLRGFGSEGTDPGQFHTPHGVAIDSKGFLYVVDTNNARIQKFDVRQE